MTMSRPVIFFNLDTTGLLENGVMPDIVLIAAIYGEDRFERYIVPRVPVTREATEITGFTADGASLFLHGEPMETVPLKDALNAFLDWVGLHGGLEAILLSHCGNTFHAPILYNSLKTCRFLGTSSECISDFADSHEIAKKYIPPENVENYKLITLAEKFLQGVDKTHNSVCRVKILKNLYETALANKVNIEAYCHKAKSFIEIPPEVNTIPQNF